MNARVGFIRTDDKGGCDAACACVCHGDAPDIGPGHLSTCRFADDENYVPESFERAVTEANRRAEDEILRWLNGGSPRQ